MKELVLVLIVFLLSAFNTGICKSLNAKYVLALDLPNAFTPSNVTKLSAVKSKFLSENAEFGESRIAEIVELNPRVESILTTLPSLEHLNDVSGNSTEALLYPIGNTRNETELESTTQPNSISEVTTVTEFFYGNVTENKGQNDNDFFNDPTTEGSENRSAVELETGVASEVVTQQDVSTTDIKDECGSVISHKRHKYVYTVHLFNGTRPVTYFLALLRRYFDDKECHLVIVNGTHPLTFSWTNKSLEDGSAICQAMEETLLEIRQESFRLYFLPHFVIEKVSANVLSPNECFPSNSVGRDSSTIVVASTCAVVGVIVPIVSIAIILRKKARAKETKHKYVLRNRVPALLPGEPITPKKEGQDNPAFVPTLPCYTPIKDL